MKVTERAGLAFVDTVISFTRAELTALERAAAIAGRARELMRETIGIAAAEDHPFDLLLAEIEHNPKELDAEGFVIASRPSALLRRIGG